MHEFGLNYRLPDVLCALGISQLSRLQEFKSKRKIIFERYVKSLENIPGLVLPQVNESNDVMWHLFPLRVPASDRKRIFEAMRSKGIIVQVNYLPAYRHPVFSTSNYQEGDFPISDRYFAGEISLPMYSDLTSLEQSHVIETLLGVL